MYNIWETDGMDLLAAVALQASSAVWELGLWLHFQLVTGERPLYAPLPSHSHHT